jgi:hypothetical protein
MLGRILVVEDDLDIANMLRIYFTGQDYQVEVAHRGDGCPPVMPETTPRSRGAGYYAPGYGWVYHLPSSCVPHTRTSSYPDYFSDPER